MLPCSPFLKKAQMLQLFRKAQLRIIFYYDKPYSEVLVKNLCNVSHHGFHGKHGKNTEEISTQRRKDQKEERKGRTVMHLL
jgi:hypothetical protein